MYIKPELRVCSVWSHGKELVWLLGDWLHWSILALMPQHIFFAAAEKPAVIKKKLTVLRWNSLGTFLHGQHTEAVVQRAMAASQVPSWTWYYVRVSHILLILKTWKLLTNWVMKISEKAEDWYWEIKNALWSYWTPRDRRGYREKLRLLNMARVADPEVLPGSHWSKCNVRWKVED